MRVIGIDQSYTGFGYCVDGDSKKKGFPSSKYDGDVHRLQGIRAWFTEWLRQQQVGSVGSPRMSGVDLVVMEGYANAAKFGREAAGELGGVVKLAIRDVLGTDPLIVPPTSLKKFVTGSGAAKKSQMIAHVYKKWGVMFSDDNQADAYSLEKFGEAYLAVTWDRSLSDRYLKYEVEAVDKVRHLV